VSTSAPQAAAFYQEAARERAVWGIRDRAGFPAPTNANGERSMPFWSLRSRAEKVVEQVDAYRGFEVVEIPLDTFIGRWLPGMERDELHVGLNWSGGSATGYDMPPPEVRARLRILDALRGMDDGAEHEFL